MAVLTGAGRIRGRGSARPGPALFSIVAMRRALCLLTLCVAQASAQPCVAPGDDPSLGALRAWVAACPAALDGETSGAYRLAEALEAAGDVDGAVRARVAGRRALAEVGVEDLRLDAALVRSAFGAGEVADSVAVEAQAAYFTLLERSAAAPDDVVGVHLRALAAVLGGEAAERYGLGERGVPDSPGLVRWWRRQDPRPGTAVNERVAEHLRRVAEATTAYAPDGALDDRGRVYVRFGPPAWTTRVAVEGGEFARYVAERVPGLRPSSFPRNEVWGYPDVDETATYLFVESGPGGPYREGTAEDLVPRTLRTGLGSGGRGAGKARALVFVLDAIYRQLAQVDVRYAGPALEARRYADVLDQVEREAMLEPSPSPTEAPTPVDAAVAALGWTRGDRILQGALPQPVGVFAQTALAESYARGEALAAERDARVPPARTLALADVAVVPVAVRTARFLSPTGQTRTEVAWAVDPSAFGSARDPVLLWHLAEQDAGYRTTALHRGGLRVEPGARPGDRFPAQTYEVDGPGAGGHLAMEWSVYDRGELVGLASARVDSVRALRAEGLEMSDLKPLVTGVDEPYPYARVVPGEGLTLYFEVYGLRDDDGTARFDVVYETVRRREGGLLRRSREVVTDGRLVTHTVGDRASEYLYLSAADWAGADEVEVTVRVVDRRGRGAEVARSVMFEVGA